MKVRRKIGGNLLWDLITVVLILLSFLSLLWPVARYKYRAKMFPLNGYSLLTGKKIAGGSVTVSPNVALYIMLGLAVVAIVSLLLFGRKKQKIAAEIQAIFGIYGVIAPVLLASKMSGILQGAKGVTAQFGMYYMAIVSLLVLILAFIKLSDNKVLCSLDFMVLPGMIYLFINNYIPMAGLYISFKNVDYSVGLWKSPWVGFKNFKSLFTNDSVWTITRNTMLYNVAFIILGIVTGIVVGICLSEVARKFMQKTYQTLILLPQLISYVIVAYIVYAFLSPDTGMITKVFESASSANFYAKPIVWPFILIFVNLWKMLGYNSIVFLAAIVGIDRSLYEAAKVDGATKWKQIWYVTIPQLKPTIITLFLLQTGRIFYSDFGLFYQVPLNSGALYDVTDTIDTFVYRALMVNNNISLASAASTYQAIVGFIIVLCVNLIVRKVDRENALF